MYKLVLQVIPFFLAARLITDAPWTYGPEYTFDVQVNSVAVAEDSLSSIRLQILAKLVCQPKWDDVFSCHFSESQATSFLSNSLDPYNLGNVLRPSYRQEAYEFHQDQFEVNFRSYYMEKDDSLVVSENIQPREVDMIRLIIGQLYIGGIVLMFDLDGQKISRFEKFTHGECMTTTILERSTDQYGMNMKRDYELRSRYPMKDGEVVMIRKTRDLNNCRYQVPYYFGSAADKHGGVVMSSLELTASEIVVSDSGFASQTENVILMGPESDRVTLYESISLKLESIFPAQSEPLEVKNPETISAFIGRMEEKLEKEEEEELEESEEVEEEQEEGTEEEEAGKEVEERKEEEKVKEEEEK